MRDPFNHIGRPFFSWGRSEGVPAFQTGVASHVAWEEYAVFLDV